MQIGVSNRMHTGEALRNVGGAVSCGDLLTIASLGRIRCGAVLRKFLQITRSITVTRSAAWLSSAPVGGQAREAIMDAVRPSLCIRSISSAGRQIFLLLLLFVAALSFGDDHTPAIAAVPAEPDSPANAKVSNYIELGHPVSGDRGDSWRMIVAKRQSRHK